MIYVLIQFVSITILAFGVDIANISYLQIALLTLSAILGAMAVYAMKVSNLNVLPDLKKNAQLRTNSIYSLVRHPMYTSVLLLCLALVINNTTIFTITIYILLFINLILKARYEEKVLLEQFKQYKQYKEKTSMFFPLKYLQSHFKQ